MTHKHIVEALLRPLRKDSLQTELLVLIGLMLHQGRIPEAQRQRIIHPQEALALITMLLQEVRVHRGIQVLSTTLLQEVLAQATRLLQEVQHLQEALVHLTTLLQGVLVRHLLEVVAEEVEAEVEEDKKHISY